MISMTFNALDLSSLYSQMRAVLDTASGVPTAPPVLTSETQTASTHTLKPEKAGKLPKNPKTIEGTATQLDIEDAIAVAPVSIDDCRKKLREAFNEEAKDLAKDVGPTAFLELLTEFKVKKVADLPADKTGVFMQRCDAFIKARIEARG